MVKNLRLKHLKQGSYFLGALNQSECNQQFLEEKLLDYSGFVREIDIQAWKKTKFDFARICVQASPVMHKLAQNWIGSLIDLLMSKIE